MAIWRRKSDIRSSSKSARPDGAVLDIDLDAIVRNWRSLRARAGTVVGAAIKADAYGLGADRVGPALDRAGCRNFFVAALSEALALAQDLIDAAPPRTALEDRRIYVLNGFAPDATGVAACDQPGPRIAPVISTLKSWRGWADFWHVGSGRPPVAALQIESGMNRLGAPLAELADIAPEDFPSGGELLVMSHLASADEPQSAQNGAQKQVFDAALIQLRMAFPQLKASLGATGGGLLDPSYGYDLVRAGVGLYGGMPFTDAEPVVEFSAPILRVAEVEPGAHIGYNGTWTAARPSVIATAAIGYADGLPRALSNRGVALINGALVPIIGRVSMDLTVLDVTDLDTRLTPGGRAFFLMMGQDAPPELRVDAVAALADTIGYEILTRLSAAPRVYRRYRGGGGTAPRR